MDKNTIELVQKTWEMVVPIGPAAANLFYQNLFKADPTIKKLFKGDMEEQGKKLMQMIGAAVGKLNDLDKLVPILQDLAKRHHDYGVKVEHYETVGAALLETLQQGLGEAFTPDVRAAWEDVYRVMVNVMSPASLMDS